MRLLSCTNLELHEFFDDDVPDYAILSHTWEKGQEVSFQELQLHGSGARSQDPIVESSRSALTDRTGYDKILRCARQALSDGWDWVWIDTCCIDKSSSAELSEAINSMYQWYKAAAVCYAYLSDVSRTYVDDVSGANEETTEQLWNCKW